MLLRTHFVMSVFLGLILFGFLDFTGILFFVFIILGGIFSDIDTKNSRIGKKFYLRPIQWMTKHRGIFHSFLFGFIIFVIIYYFDNSAGFGFLTGFVLHLFLDCFSKSGVRIFHPFFNFKLKFFRIKSGGLIEEVLFVLFLVLDVVLFIRLLLIT